MNQPVAPVRERILSEATRLFAERGVSGTSIAAVAAAAGITKPTLVYHFGSKDGLRLAVLQGLMAHWKGELPRMMLAAQGEGPRIDGLLTALLSFFQREPQLARVVVREALDRPDELQALLREHLQPWTGLLTQAIRAGQAQGTLRPEVDPEAFTVLVIATALGLLAVGPPAGALVSPEPDAQRQIAQLVRMARTALLLPKELS